MSSATKYLPFGPGITTTQASAYLLFVCLFSISFLVFLNSSVSFVITDLLHVKRGVGDLVGTLGFADELVALVFCPIWGIVSDRLGVRWVCFLGYMIVGASLMVFVQAKNVYPQLLLARMGFSVGGAATATMVTAILPSMASGQRRHLKKIDDRSVQRLRSAATAENRNSMTPSLDSQLTITPNNYTSFQSIRANTENQPQAEGGLSASASKLAGLVGLFTGCGALLALGLFLPLPAQFSTIDGISQGQAVADSFYVVGSIALLVAILCFFGLNNLQGEEGKGWNRLVGKQAKDEAQHNHAQKETFLPYWSLLAESFMLSFKDAQIGLGYLGGFVARASSVGITLFIPLYTNAYFISHGFCQGNPTDTSPELKKECRAAYILAAELTGASQIVALLCAPVFGYLADRYQHHNIPLLFASLCGIVGYVALANVRSPEVKDIEGRGGSPIIFLIVSLIGISQIGAIVCSLGLLGQGINDAEDIPASTTQTHEAEQPLLGATSSASQPETVSRSHLKGSIAGVYSLFGGAAILLLTKLGGYLFDRVSRGAPFYMMAGFNAALLVVGMGRAGFVLWKTRQFVYP